MTGDRREFTELSDRAAKMAASRVHVLDGLVKRYMTLKNAKHPAIAARDWPRDERGRFVSDPGARERRLAMLAKQIRCLDGVIQTKASIGAKFAATITLYYRCRYDSVGVAQHLNVSPPCVRQWLRRLNQTARTLGLE